MLIAACAHKEVKPPESDDTLPFYNTADFDAVWLTPQDKGYSAIHTIDTFCLYSQEGRVITSDSLKGKVYIANFFFTICPSICPKMMNNLRTLQDTFAGNDAIRLVSFSVMPWVDSVSHLRDYAERNNIDPYKWYLLTGSKERIYDLGRRSYFAEKGLGLQKDATEFLHTETMLLIDSKARIRGIYNATQKPDMERAIEDIHILLKEVN